MTAARTSSDAPPRPQALLERVLDHAATHPDRIAYEVIHSCGAQGAKLSYAQLVASAAKIARNLRSRVACESIVLLCSPNTCDYPAAFLGILLADCVAFPVTPMSTAVELRAAAEASKASAIIGTDAAIAAVKDIVPHAIALIDVLMKDATREAPALPRSTGDPRLLLHSSGTSGRPKIVKRSGLSLDAVSHQMAKAVAFSGDDMVLAMVPLCHSYGLEHGLLAPLYAGSRVRLCAGFDLPTALRELQAGHITVLPSVPSVYEMLANLAQSGTTFPGLRAAYSAGGPLPRSVQEKLANDNAIRLSQLYGATEIGSVTYSHPNDAHFDPASVGRAMAGVELRIEPADGQLLARARSMFSGYLHHETSYSSVEAMPASRFASRDEAATQASPPPDGFFPTGDLARLDAHGNLTLTGRLKLLIDVGGLKVNPLEVEDVLLAHPGVGACVVVPVRQSETVYRIKAVITPVDATNPPSPEGVRQFARERLAAHKVPRLVEIRAKLPRSSTGKILRHLVETS